MGERGDYDAVYRASMDDPGAFWLDAARGVDWVTPPTRAHDDRRPLVRWFPGARLNTCHNALDRHVDGWPGRPGRPGLRQPGHRGGADAAPTGSCATRWPGSPGVLRQPGVGHGRPGRASTCRWSPRPWSPCWPAPGSAPCTRWSSAGSPPHELAVRIDDARPRSSCRRRAASSRTGSSTTSPCSTWRWTRPSTGPSTASSCSGRRLEAALVAGRDLDWAEPMAEADPPPACHRSRPPTRCTSSTPRARPARPRASSATTAATPWPCRGAWRHVYGVAPGERVLGGHRTSAGSSATPTSSTRPLLAGATTVLYEGKPVGTPDAGAFWRVVADHGVDVAVHRAHGHPGHPERGPRRRAAGRPRPVRAARPVPGGRAARPRHLPLGRRDARASRSSTTGGRPRPGWPIAANCLGIEPLPIKPGSPTKPVPGYDVRVLDERRRPCRAGVEGAVCPSGCRCRRARCRRCTRTTSATSAPTCRAFPGHYLTGDGGYSTRTATCS